MIFKSQTHVHCFKPEPGEIDMHDCFICAGLSLSLAASTPCRQIASAANFRGMHA